jgi:hypothetical protein
MLKAVLAGVVFLAILNGCSEFQLASSRKNVEVENISPKVFTVNFCGNAYMNQAEVERYALQRASEEVLSKGYSHFVIVKKRDDSEVCNLNSAGRSSSGMPSERSASNQYNFQPFMKPNVTLTIQCFYKAEKIPEGAIDADEFLLKNFPALRSQEVNNVRK